MGAIASLFLFCPPHCLGCSVVPNYGEHKPLGEIMLTKKKELAHGILFGISQTTIVKAFYPTP